MYRSILDVSHQFKFILNHLQEQFINLGLRSVLKFHRGSKYSYDLQNLYRSGFDLSDTLTITRAPTPGFSQIKTENRVGLLLSEVALR